jgi:hypothetical protein
VGDVMLRAPGAPGLNLFVWVAAVAIAAIALQLRLGLRLDAVRNVWLAGGGSFAAHLMWRD